MLRIMMMYDGFFLYTDVGVIADESYEAHHNDVATVILNQCLSDHEVHNHSM